MIHSALIHPSMERFIERGAATVGVSAYEGTYDLFP